MAVQTTQGRHPDPVRQFAVFTDNRPGRLHELTSLLATRDIHVLALTVLDATDSAVLRIVVDDPEQTRELLGAHGFAHAESEVLVVEINGASDLKRLMTVLLQAELNINYLYAFIPHPTGKSLLALNMEDNEMAEQALRREQFRTLKQADISR